MLHLLHDEGAFEATDVVVAANDVEEKTLIMLHIGRLDAQKVVERAADVVAFRYLGNLLYHFGESNGHLAIQTAELDAAEDGKALVELAGVEDGGVLADEAEALQTLHAFVGRSR